MLQKLHWNLEKTSGQCQNNYHFLGQGPSCKQENTKMSGILHIYCAGYWDTKIPKIPKNPETFSIKKISKMSYAMPQEKPLDTLYRK